MVERTKFTTMVVKTKEGISSSGRMMRLAQKTPRGGIHAVLRILATVRVDCDKYSIQPLQNMARARLISGITIQLRSWERDGKKRTRPKLNRVRITPWTIPKVMRRAY